MQKETKATFDHVDERRIRFLNSIEYKKDIVVYWMQREQRVSDNWALLYAKEIADAKSVPLVVVFSLVPEFLDATLRQYDFMIKGLVEVEKNLAKLNIPFILLEGNPGDTITNFVQKNDVGFLVGDFNPLRIKEQWNSDILNGIDVPFQEVDSHNIVPCWVTSDKQEFAARTIRPKINSRLDEFLIEFPQISKQDKTIIEKGYKEVDWESLLKKININNSVKPVEWIRPGESEAKKVLNQFITNKLKTYEHNHSNPAYENESNLSPYLHFGQISSQRIAIEIKKSDSGLINKDAFLEQIIIRKELTDNFCFYNKNYDSSKGFPDWVKQNYKNHNLDERDYIYSLEEFEEAKTHDRYWNSAQLEMIRKGKMHNYMRMYWAKKILEWTKTPEDALKIAIYLNDKYELDGRDPNGYVGVMWSIGGVHDRPWFERDIYGKVRYMASAGLERKFDMNKYINYVNNLPE